jgi:hypothetical protein
MAGQRQLEQQETESFKPTTEVRRQHLEAQAQEARLLMHFLRLSLEEQAAAVLVESVYPTMLLRARLVDDQTF